MAKEPVTRPLAWASGGKENFMDRNDTTHRELVALLEELKASLKERTSPEYTDLAANVNFMRSREPYSQWLYTFVISKQALTAGCLEDRKISGAGLSSEAIVPAVEPIKELIARDSNALTEFGKLMQEKVRGGTIVDLGAGDAEAPGVERWGEIFGAKEYIGIDLGEDETAYQHGSTINYRLKQDNLILISTLPDSSVSMFHIAGIERDENFDNDEIKRYFECLINEMKRALKPGGIIAVGPGCDEILRDEKMFAQAGLEQSLKVINRDRGHPFTTEYLATYFVYCRKEVAS